MTIQDFIIELNNNSPSYEEYNRVMASYSGKESSFRSYEEMNLLSLEKKKFKKYKFDFKNEMLNELYGYNFNPHTCDIFSLMYPHLEKNNFIIFGSGENGISFSYMHNNEEIILLDEDTYQFYQYACKDIESFFYFLIQLKEVDTDYHYRNGLISKSKIEELVYVVGGEKYRGFVKENILRYTEFW